MNRMRAHGFCRIISAAKRANVMSALGQKQTCAVHQPMSALPPKADIRQRFNSSGTGRVQSVEICLLAHVVFGFVKVAQRQSGNYHNQRYK
jgi:hypothetical protein